jgi:hypothetical protein
LAYPRTPAASALDGPDPTVQAGPHAEADAVVAESRSWWTGRRLALLLAAGWLVQAGLRAWFSRDQSIPLANPDETAYLIAARVLAGGTGANFSGSTLYQGGYPLLITPVYWFTHNPVTVYHAVTIINAVVSALVMPLGYLACRRLGLDRPVAYAVAALAALVPAGFFYSQYAMADAIFPVVMLAWLLSVHSWLTATSPRARYAAAVGSAVAAGFAYTTHSRGLVMLFGFAVVAAAIAWRRRAYRGAALAAGLAALVTVAAGWSLNHYLTAAIYPQGIRSLSAQLRSTLGNVNGVLHVLEMAAGQAWRLTLDSWGIAGIGLIAALAAIGWRGLRWDYRVMGALSIAVTIVIACTAPAALPADQSQTWASGRYLDGMIVTFFIVGAVVLLRVSSVRVLACAAAATAMTMLATVIVAVYAGVSVPTAGFGYAFNFAEPAVLTQNWNQANVLLATAVALGLLAVWIAATYVVRRWPGRLRAAGLGAIGAVVAAVSLVAMTQMTSHVSQAGETSRAADLTGMITATGLRPGEQLAIASNVSWYLSIPQAFEIYWAEPESFNPASQSPPANASVVETAWPAGQPARASWPNAPAGWRIVASDPASAWPWVAWRKS